MPLIWLTSHLSLVATLDDSDHADPIDDSDPLVAGQVDNFLTADDVLIADYMDDDSDDDNNNVHAAQDAQPVTSPHVRFEEIPVSIRIHAVRTYLILISHRGYFAQMTGQSY